MPRVDNKGVLISELSPFSSLLGLKLSSVYFNPNVLINWPKEQEKRQVGYIQNSNI